MNDAVSYGIPATASVSQFQIFRTEQHKEWTEVLRRVVRHDFHHLPQYHRVEERRLAAIAHLFTYCEGDYLIALPLLLQAVGQGLPGWNDATSVYGYGGPVASHERMPESVVHNFQAALRETLVERRVVAAFSRLHPLIVQQDLLIGLGECQPVGQTVSIDLTLPLEQQRAQYRRMNKQRINKQRREGAVVCLYDQEKRYFSEFVSIYEKTMRRVNAEHTYFFGEDYFSQLCRELSAVLHLFVAVADGKIAAAGLFTICNGIVQSHLIGTRKEFIKLSPTALMIDTVRLWANEIGARVLHLGGGVGAKCNSLFQHKTGFSDRRHDFATWRWVVMPEIYCELCERWSRMNKLDGLEPASDDYFPAYRRRRTVPCALESQTVPKSRTPLPHTGEVQLKRVKGTP